MKRQVNYILGEREPKSVLKFFEEICAIPHGSGNEREICEYVIDFAKARGLWVYTDSLCNVLIKKPGSEGYERCAPVMLQGHLDMVCEKNSDVVHDFLTDGLSLSLDEDGWLSADGTTLGGDDGIAVAMMLALLDSKDISHPPLECLFTTGEETGLFGATGFDYSNVSARRLINLDSEAEETVTAGCAGGVRSDILLSADTHTLAFEEAPTVEISLRGLAGGHSGADIHTGRANANKLMGRLLASLAEKVEYKLVSIDGGSKDNAIPRECRAVILPSDTSAAIAGATELLGKLCDEICTANSPDKDFSFVLKRGEGTNVAFDDTLTAKAVALLASVQNGVLEMSRNISGLVEFSRNLGIVASDRSGVKLSFSSRSAIDSQLDASIAEIDALARAYGATSSHHSRYIGWAFKEDSPIREKYCEVYSRLYSKPVTVSVIHAGLECGIISGAIPDMDMISVGPNMKDIHSPDEMLDLNSVERVWKVILTLLEEFK